ncbi:MAG: TOBE domain-containing protein [Anaerolineae bacterium]
MWQQAVLGIRPEHLRVESTGPLHTVVNVVAPVLSQRVQYVYSMLAGRRLVARLPEELRLAAGDPLSLDVPESALQLFDHESQQRLPDATIRRSWLWAAIGLLMGCAQLAFACAPLGQRLRLSSRHLNHTHSRACGG